jgi:hypothetical protein
VTKRVNPKMSRYGDMRPKALAVSMIATATLISTMGVVTSTSEHSINGQMMIGDRGGFGNMTLEQAIFEAIGSKANTSLTQATTTAEQSVGNNSFALAAFAADYDGDLVYTIILGSPGMEYYNVTVDPGNGQILATEELSQEKLEERHQMHMARSAGGSPFSH